MARAAPLNGVDFSVIVPTFDRPSELAACLGALGQQDYEHAAFEVIVVDDGGRGVLDATMASLPAAISRKLLRQTNAGPAAARNRGAANARGTWLAFTDDDCRPAPGWLSAIARRLGQAPGCAVGGRTLNGATDSYFAEASQAIIEAVYRHYNADPDHARFFAAANLAVPAAAFRSVGGFDEGFRTSEDREFCDRWLHDGGRLLHAPEAIIWHDGGPRTLVHFWKQHFGYGRGARRFRGLAASRSSIPVKLESASFYRRLLCSPMREGINPRSLLVATLAVASQLASACGYWAEGRQAEVGPPAGTAGDAARTCGRRL